jgi:hypothetical protein
MVDKDNWRFRWQWGIGPLCLEGNETHSCKKLGCSVSPVWDPLKSDFPSARIAPNGLRRTWFFWLISHNHEIEQHRGFPQLQSQGTGRRPPSQTGPFFPSIMARATSRQTFTGQWRQIQAAKMGFTNACSHLKIYKIHGQRSFNHQETELRALLQPDTTEQSSDLRWELTSTDINLGGKARLVTRENQRWIYMQYLKLLVAGFSLLVVAESLLSSREDDTRSWGNFLVYFSHKFIQCHANLRGWGYIFIELLASQAYAKMLV